MLACQLLARQSRLRLTQLQQAARPPSQPGPHKISALRLFQFADYLFYGMERALLPQSPKGAELLWCHQEEHNAASLHTLKTMLAHNRRSCRLNVRPPRHLHLPAC